MSEELLKLLKLLIKNYLVNSGAVTDSVATPNLTDSQIESLIEFVYNSEGKELGWVKAIRLPEPSPSSEKFPQFIHELSKLVDYRSIWNTVLNQNKYSVVTANECIGKTSQEIIKLGGLLATNYGWLHAHAVAINNYLKEPPVLQAFSNNECYWGAALKTVSTPIEGGFHVKVVVY